jgi:tetratricopeptide (TPR) repeat protein
MERSQTFLMLGDIPHALGTINAAIEDDPDYAPAYLVRAAIWLRSGDFKKAADDYSQVIAHGLDHSAYVYTARGNAHAAGSDYAAAIADYEQALKIKPGYWPAIAGRGSARAETGDAARALADLDSTLAHDPGDMTEVLASKPVMELSRKGPPARGTQTLSVTIPSLPILVMSYVARGKLRFTQGAYQPALADFDEALKRAPKLVSARFYHGLTLLALGRCTDGEAELHAPGMPAMAAFQGFMAAHRDALAKAGCPAATP